MQSWANRLESKFWKSSKEVSKFNKVFDLLLLVLFSVAFFSIPAFSFYGTGKYLTWFFVIALIVFIVLSFCFFYDIKIDFIGISFLLFAVSATVSSLLTGFKAFKTTPIFLSLLSFCIYTFCKSIKETHNLTAFLAASFIGAIAFLFLFIYEYRNELIHLNFSRLGSEFGDENDISLFLGFGLVCSLYFGLNFSKKTIFLNVILLIISALFVLCGFSTGSKIFLFEMFLCFAFFPIFKCGRKRIWLALSINVGLLVIFLIVLQFPFLSTIKDRFMSFLSTLFGGAIGNGNTNELSTINRVDMFLCGMQMWLRRPLFGWGIWGFATYSGREGGWSHNNISESFCNFGLIGTLLFHFGFIVSIYEFIRARDKKNLGLPILLLFFYLTAMLGVALNSQKIYALVIGVIFALLSDTKVCFEIPTFKRIMKRGKCNENFNNRQ